MKRSPLLLFSALLALAAGLAGQAGASGTPAGTVIQNQASATADPFVAGDPGISALSNLVESVVSPLCSVSVTPDGTVAAPGQSSTLLPGDGATFTYRVTNAGNITNTYVLKALVDAASAFTPAPLNVYLDANNDGQLADTERASEVGSLTLAPDAGQTVFVVAATSDSSRGDAFVNLSAACPGGAPADSNNVSRIRVGEPPAVSLVKTFTPALVKPGDVATVTLVARNDGQGASRTLVLSDALNTLAAQGLSYVPGSASASTGGTSAGTTPLTPEYTTDGAVYSATEPGAVSGLRVSVGSLAPAQSLTLSFRMLAAAGAENKTLTNTATAVTGGVTTTASANLDVRYQAAALLGPVGNAAAPEGTPADSQSQPFAVVGQAICFDHTLLNSGNVADTFRLTLALSGGQATTTLLGADGQPFAQPVLLQPGQSVVVRVCYTPTAAGPLQAVLTATGGRGESNATRDLIGDVQAGLPTLVKTASTSGTVMVGDTVTYTLKLNNPYTRILTAALAQDKLSDALTFVSASDGGTYDPATRTVSWNLGTLQPAETRTLTLVATVSAAAVDGQTLSNSFTLSSAELPRAISSNLAQNPIWSAQLVIVKTVNNLQASYGDRLTYTLAIQNLSKTTAVTEATITDTLPAGLVYVPGTTTLAGAAYTDPAVAGPVLTWSGLSIPAGGTLQLTYGVRVTPAATGDLINIVVVRGNGGNATAIASNTAKAMVKINPLSFAPLGDLIGYVYVDRHRDGQFQQNTDLPLYRARVILAGGRIALTDEDGRYHFANVPFGTQAVRLDPASVPYSAIKLPTEGGLNGTQTVFVRGLTSVDFPLAPVYGDIQVLRRTVLTMGELSVQKTVYVTGNLYSVQLLLTTSAELPGFVLRDPLPTGAVPQGQGPTLPTDTLKAGETLLNYQFTFDGERGAAVTDPSASWRY
ncbi:DUF11 domain-containing protein [Deinococcus altitudinis]|uniref:DUF7933 domain-containing protein n=1 Tax=Deinococcus altitudinis TaxID=468914 RepID=UPI0038914EB8